MLQTALQVWLSDAEVSPLAQHLGVLPATFLQLYCQPYHSIPGWHLLLSKQQRQQQQQQKPHSAAAGGALGQPAAAVCVFLDESTNGCVVYPVRPVQCSTYPWWPEIMSDSHWRLEKGRRSHCIHAFVPWDMSMARLACMRGRLESRHSGLRVAWVGIYC